MIEVGIDQIKQEVNSIVNRIDGIQKKLTENEEELKEISKKLTNKK